MTIPRARRVQIERLYLDEANSKRFVVRLLAQPFVVDAQVAPRPSDGETYPYPWVAVRPPEDDTSDPGIRHMAHKAIRAVQGEFGLDVPLESIGSPQMWWSGFDAALEDIDRVRESIDRIAKHDAPEDDVEPPEVPLASLARVTAWVTARERQVDPMSAEARDRDRAKVARLPQHGDTNG
jgi:hypothetical protein